MSENIQKFLFKPACAMHADRSRTIKLGCLRQRHQVAAGFNLRKMRNLKVAATLKFLYRHSGLCELLISPSLDGRGNLSACGHAQAEGRVVSFFFHPHLTSPIKGEELIV